MFSAACARREGGLSDGPTTACFKSRGSKFKAVNNRDKNFTSHKIQMRMQQLEHSFNRDLVNSIAPIVIQRSANNGLASAAWPALRGRDSSVVSRLSRSPDGQSHLRSRLLLAASIPQ
jgi:hypothetical protein